jgi:hypothetical protein
MSRLALLEYFWGYTKRQAGGAKTVKYSRVKNGRKKRERRSFHDVREFLTLLTAEKRRESGIE